MNNIQNKFTQFYDNNLINQTLYNKQVTGVPYTIPT